MPRVLRIINRFNLGGPTYNAAYLTKYLAPEFETMLIGGRKDASEANSEYIVNNLGIQALTIPQMRRSVNYYHDTLALKQIKKIISEFKPDIVHTHASKAGALGRRAAAALDVPVILHTFHGHVFDAYFSGFRSSFYQFIERKLAKVSTKIIALSDIQKNDLVFKYKICPEEKVEIIPLGFDLSRFRENMEGKRKVFREKYNIADDEIAIGIIGRVVPIKNHELFLNGFNYARMHTSKKIKAFIVGDGEERQRMEKKALSMGFTITDVTKENVSADVSFTSWLKDIDSVNAGMDIIALTSLNEGTPVSLIEAQASDKPIVTTRVGGIENIVISGKTALLSDVADVEGLGNNILSLVENDEMRKEIGNNGWAFVENKFHFTRLVNDMKNLYCKLLEEYKSR